MKNIYKQALANAESLFAGPYMEAKLLYLFCFRALPDTQYIGLIDGEKLYKSFMQRFSKLVKKVYKSRWYEHKRKEVHFDLTFVVLKNNCILEFEVDYCEVYHDGNQEDFVKEILLIASKYRERQRRQPLEINIVMQGRNGLHLSAREIKKVKLDLDLYYPEDFREIDALIQKRLNKKNDKGIVLLHGMPGTGKTTYLRYVIGKIKKRVLFISPAVAGNLMNPEFIELLVKNANTVLVIEDADNIIMDRKFFSGSSVSNLLNISDGLLADFLNVQLICTFNSPLTMVDSALTRKGRLIAKYEFGKLSIEKAQNLSRHMGFDRIITTPMTMAEIAGQDEQNETSNKNNLIGFKRQNELWN